MQEEGSLRVYASNKASDCILMLMHEPLTGIGSKQEKKRSLGPLMPASSASSTHCSHVSPGYFRKFVLWFLKRGLSGCGYHTADPLVEGVCPTLSQLPCLKRDPSQQLSFCHGTPQAAQVGVSKGYLSLGQQLASSAAQGFPESFPDKNEALLPFLCLWTEALLEAWA